MAHTIINVSLLTSAVWIMFSETVICYPSRREDNSGRLHWTLKVGKGRTAASSFQLRPCQTGGSGRADFAGQAWKVAAELPNKLQLESEIIGPEQRWHFQSEHGSAKSLESLHFTPTTQEVRGNTDRCLAVGESSYLDGSSPYWTKCTGCKSQAWVFDRERGSVKPLPASHLCLQVGGHHEPLNCSYPPLNQLPYCNWTLPVADRVQDLVARMVLTEKAELLQDTNPGVKRLGLPKLQFAECLHGVWSKCGDPANNESTGCPTSFPCPLSLAASYNRTMWLTLASTISDEARALHNQGKTGLAFWSPNINLFRDPRWGRGQEVPGEDPYLTSEYVYQYSRGLQTGKDPRYTKVISTCKHFSAYDLEKWHHVNRHHFNAIISDQDLVEYYWVPFQACIERAQAQSIMCSYNEVNGIPSCVNSLFQNTIVRDKWGFEGFIVSDCGAIFDVIMNHNFTSTSGETCEAALTGGCDLDCGGYFRDYLELALHDGYVSEDQVTLAANRILTHMFKLGVMDPQDDQPYTKLSADHVDTPVHRHRAQDAARQGVVLLKNKNNLLPLNKDKLSSIAIIGPHANSTQALLSDYYGTNTVVNHHSPLQAIGRMLDGDRVRYSRGCDVDSNDTSHFDEAVNLAKTADSVVLFLGLDQDHESEGQDRKFIDLPGLQLALTQKILAVNNRTSVVLINGGPIAIEWIQDNVPAILEAFYPGEMGGDAIADILFGDYSPAGRLPYTIYPADYIKRSYFNMDLRNDSGCTYRYYTGIPLWEFGFGLSYTNFTFHWNDSGMNNAIVLDTVQLGKHDVHVNYTVLVKNTGSVDSDVSVLGFLSALEQPDAPIKQLFDFARTHIKAGQEETVHLMVSPASLATVDRKGIRAIRKGRYKVQIENLIRYIVIDGDDYELFNLALLRQVHEQMQADRRYSNKT